MHDDDMPVECECDCMCEEGLSRVTGVVVIVMALLLATLFTEGWGLLSG